jgi:hypothetical protein
MGGRIAKYAHTSVMNPLRRATERFGRHIAADRALYLLD